MFSGFLLWLAILFGVLTVAVLGAGLFGLVKKDAISSLTSNKLMRFRVLFQFIVVILLVAFIWFSQG